jgi:hypothetical protein
MTELAEKEVNPQMLEGDPETDGDEANQSRRQSGNRKSESGRRSR